MKHKYVIARDNEKGLLILKEYGELDKEMMSFLCEASYNDDNIHEAIQHGKDALVSTVRTENIYPPNLYADKIADAIIAIYDAGNDMAGTEIVFDDLDWLTKDQEAYPIEDEVEEEEEDSSDDDIDDLLEDDFEDDFGDDEDLKLDSPLKIADDESGDFDDET